MLTTEDLVRRCPNCRKMVMSHQAIIVNKFDIQVMFHCEHCDGGFDYLIECEVNVSASL